MRIIRITKRLCSKNLYPRDVNPGDMLLAVDTDTLKDGTGVLLCKRSMNDKNIIRLNSKRFKVEEISYAKVEKSLRRQEEKARLATMVHTFTKDELLAITAFPLIVNAVAFKFANKAMDLAAEHRIEATRPLRKGLTHIEDEYKSFVIKGGLSYPIWCDLNKNVDKFYDAIAKDNVIAFFSINNALKKFYPEYPYSDTRTWAAMALGVIMMGDRYIEKCNAKMAEKLGEGNFTPTLRCPVIDKLVFIADALLGIRDFDYNKFYSERNVKLNFDIFEIRLNEIDFGLDDLHI